MGLAGGVLFRAQTNWRRYRRRRRWESLVADHPLKADECGLIAAEGIGDHLLVGLFAKAVLEAHGLTVRFVAGNPRYGFLEGLYPPGISYLPWRTEPEDVRFGPDLRGGSFYFAHFPGLELMRAVGYDRFHFLDAYRCRLGLPPDSTLTAPRPPSDAERIQAQEALAAQGLRPGRTVVLCTDARSTPYSGPTPEFWQSLAAALEARGLQAVVNAGPQTIVPAGLKAWGIPLDTFRAIALSAGYIVSVRSGLSDLACDLPCPQCVIYADAPYWAGPLHKGTTFDRYGLATPPHEVVYQPADWMAVVKAIVDRFDTDLKNAAPQKR
jgi:hypothetical protein